MSVNPYNEGRNTDVFREAARQADNNAPRSDLARALIRNKRRQVEAEWNRELLRRFGPDLQKAIQARQK
jgi:hypothetical protein